jgi:sugar phosphate isomerase/epimerase
MVRRIAGDLGLEITIFQPFRDFEAMPEPLRARNLDRAERKFDVMQALGTDLMLSTIASSSKSSSGNAIAGSAPAQAQHRGGADLIDRLRASFGRRPGPMVPQAKAGSVCRDDICPRG